MAGNPINTTIKVRATTRDALKHIRHVIEEEGYEESYDSVIRKLLKTHLEQHPELLEDKDE